MAACPACTTKRMIQEGWLFEPVAQDPFFDQFRYLRWAHIDGGSVAKCVPDLVISCVILVIDSFLKLGATKTKLAILSTMMKKMLERKRLVKNIARSVIQFESRYFSKKV